MKLSILIFTTPEHKKFAFKIPPMKNEFATNGRINSTFIDVTKQIKELNPHIDFKYLAHDLEHRGLHRTDIVEFSAKHLRAPIKTKSDNWQETADVWQVTINGQQFEYFTGIGHRIARPFQGNRDAFNFLKNKTLTDSGLKQFIAVSTTQEPSCADVLYSLMNDSDACTMSFNEWCDNFGYETDSRKALSTYHACQENTEKLRKAKLPIEAVKEALQDY